MLLAIKFHDDRFYANSYYAAVGGIALEELNKLETEMLSLLQFSLHVQPGLFYQYVRNIQETLSSDEDATFSEREDECLGSGREDLQGYKGGGEAKTVGSQSGLAEQIDG